jgi:hypothetical protein
MLTQLNPPIPVFIPINSHGFPSGDGLAHIVIDYSPEFHLFWIIFMDTTGEIWIVPNIYVRAQKNISMGRTVESGV